MEPGDLRVNKQFFNKKKSLQREYLDVYEEKSNSSRSRNLAEGTSGFKLSHPLNVASLVPDRSEEVKVWRDPNLIASTEIRHVDSLQHTFMSHGQPAGNGEPFHHGSPSRLSHLPHMAIPSIMAQNHLAPNHMPPNHLPPNHGSQMKHSPSPSRSPHLYSQPKTELWRGPRYPPAPLPSDEPHRNSGYRDYPIEHEGIDKKIESKFSAEQAVHQHFEESLRLAHKKRGWMPPRRGGEQLQGLSIRGTMSSAIPHSSEKHFYGAGGYPNMMGHGMKKTELPTPPPLTTEPKLKLDPGRSPSVYGNNLRDGGLDPSFIVQGRGKAPFPYPSPGPAHHINRVKVSSPAPQQIYGKPNIPQLNVATVRNCEQVCESDAYPLPLTSKGSTRGCETTSNHSGLPKHEVKSADLAYYMYSTGGGGPPPFIPSALKLDQVQTQPLDLGGKKKADWDPRPDTSKRLRVDEPYESSSSCNSNSQPTNSLQQDLSKMNGNVSPPREEEKRKSPPKEAEVPPRPPITITPTLGNIPGSSVHKLKKAWLQRHSGEDVLLPGKDSVEVAKETPSNTDKNWSPKPADVKSAPIENAFKSTPGKKVKKARKKAVRRNGRKVENGHRLNLRAPSSSESDVRQESPARKPATKRKTPEIKKKGSDSESGKESGESEDRSSKEVEQQNSPGPGGRKRGRKPRKEPANIGGKKSNPFKRPPINQLKKSGEKFLQDGSCTEVAPKLGKCRECRWSPNNRSKKQQNNIFCRFYAFRKLRYTKNGVLAMAGFSDPISDPTKDDLSLWLPSQSDQSDEKSFQKETSKFLISQLGDQFCKMIQEEKEALELDCNQDDQNVTWKRVVQGVREMCDVCDNTLFNLHWACGKCGFVVCISCYKARKNCQVKASDDSGKERDEYQWLLCTNRQSHELEKIMLAQVIAGDSLNKLGDLVHRIRHSWKIPQNCNCEISQQLQRNEISKPENSNGVTNKEAQLQISDDKTADLNSKKTPLNKDEGLNEESGDRSTLRDLLVREGTAEKEGNEEVKKSDQVDSGEKKEETNGESIGQQSKELKHFVRTGVAKKIFNNLVPIPTINQTESKELFPGVPHSWICDGRVIRLVDPDHPKNHVIFNEMWKRGQPVIVSNVNEKLNKPLWTPESFSRDFSDVKSSLINLKSGKNIGSTLLKKFWDGYDQEGKRMKDDKGNPMLLRIEDWPPSEEFAEIVPTRFKDLSQALPLKELTDRNGRLNLAARLPDNFIKPDLGPRLHMAYGSPHELEKGTSCLQFDISDSMNLLVHVALPDKTDEHNQAFMQAVGDCDKQSLKRVSDKSEHPGALWHIYDGRDADKIRDLLNKVLKEGGKEVEMTHDPLLDQTWYLDQKLRERLRDDYDVQGFGIIQCLGDAIFIPAGALYQVLNLESCMKVAVEFVSPQNMSQCFNLMEETRRGQEDKIQMKNIMYHAVKDAVGVLEHLKPEEDE